MAFMCGGRERLPILKTDTRSTWEAAHAAFLLQHPQGRMKKRTSTKNIGCKDIITFNRE